MSLRLAALGEAELRRRLRGPGLTLHLPPFVARLRPQKISWASDYDHLSRKGEWADGDEP